MFFEYIKSSFFVRLEAKSRSRIGGAHIHNFASRTTRLGVHVTLYKGFISCEYDIASLKNGALGRPAWGGCFSGSIPTLARKGLIEIAFKEKR